MLLKKNIEKIFVDREECISFILKNLKNFDSKKDEEINVNIIVLFGIGGIGKSELLEYLIKKSKKEFKNCEIVDINFNIWKNSNNIIDFLHFIKSRIGIKDFCFDFALLKISNYQGLRIQQFTITDNFFINIFLSFIENKFLIPDEIFKLILDKLYNLKNKYTNKKCIEEISELSIEKLLEILPSLLAQAVNEYLKKNKKKIIFFIDNYEIILANKKLDKVFQTFVRYLDNVVVVSSTREKIKWEKYDNIWQKGKYNIIYKQLQPLPCNEIEKLLRKHGIEEKNIINAIIVSSKGVPFYVDLFINIYLSKKSNNELIKLEDFKISNNEELVEKFLAHLPDDYTDIIKTLSISSFFNLDMFEKIFGSKTVNKFCDIISLSCITTIDEKKEIYKVNDIIRNVVLNLLDKKTLSSVSKDLLKYLNEYKEKIDYKMILALFYDVLTILSLNIEPLNVNDVENIISIGMFLIDRGYWNDVGEIINYFNKKNLSFEFNNTLNFLKAVYLRRINNLKESIKIFDNLNYNKLYKFKSLAIFHKTNVIRLLGDYKKALENYEKLYKVTKEREDLHIKVVRQYADLLFLKGSFKTSLNILKDYCENTFNENELEKAELYRIIGHIYKFNFMFEDALNYYKLAYNIAKEKNYIGLKAKLYTNFTEVYSFIKIKEANKYFKLSEKNNKILNSKLELGKTYSFYSICIAKFKRDFDLALEYCNKSINLHEEIGYKSGILFGYYAKFYIFSLQGNKSKAEEICNYIKERILELGVYKYLLLPCNLFFKKEYLSFNKVEWLDFEFTKKFCSNFYEK